MKLVKTLHQQSMDLAEAATLKQQQGQTTVAMELWQQAFELEAQGELLSSSSIVQDISQSGKYNFNAGQNTSLNVGDHHYHGVS